MSRIANAAAGERSRWRDKTEHRKNDQEPEWIKKLSQMLDQVRVPAARGDTRVSDHGYGELAADRILDRDVIDGLAAAVVVEDYPDYPKRAVRAGPGTR